MVTKADRYNSGKAKYSMLDLTCLEPAVRVLEFGAKKYARDNWKKGLPISEVLDSMLRHIGAIQRGEFIDPESGLPHIGHIQCNALFLGNPKATMDIEADNLLPISQELVDKIESLVEGVEFDLQKKLADQIQEEDKEVLANLTDDELGFTNGPVDKDWSRNPEEWDDLEWWKRAEIEKIPVSFEQYDAFVYALEHPSEPNEKLKRLMKGASKEEKADYARYATIRGVCAPWIGVKDDD